MINILERPDFKKAWAVVGGGLTVKNNKDYEKAVMVLDQLLDEVEDNENHPLSGYLEALSLMIENYESEHFPMQGGSGAEALKFFMEEHKLTQEDLPEIGSQGVVSEVLHGKRSLNTRQIGALSKRFGISPAVFFDT